MTIFSALGAGNMANAILSGAVAAGCLKPEEIGTYNPLTDPATVAIDAEKAKAWIANGAQPTDTVRALLKKNGVL